MRPILHPHLVNGVSGDPALYVEFLYDKRALIFDLGDLAPLAPRRLLRLSHGFVSHMHMDHFCGFDQLLRVLLGRGACLHLFGPPGFIGQLGHKLAAYTWNLVQNYPAEMAIVAGELGPDGQLKRAEFRSLTGFRRRDLDEVAVADGALLAEPGLEVRAVLLDHGTPCLGFAAEERRHVNVWKTRLEALGLRVGPWLRDLKAAVLRGDPEETPIPVAWGEEGAARPASLPLGMLRAEVLQIVPGQKIAYVTDVLFSEANAQAIVALASGADRFFIEAPFLDQDAEIAARKRHLTARQAGELARRAAVKRLIPFHFSPRYAGREADLLDEIRAAFGGEVVDPRRDAVSPPARP